MHTVSKRTRARKGAMLKRRARKREKRRFDPELVVMRKRLAAQMQAAGHPGFPLPKAQCMRASLDFD